MNKQFVTRIVGIRDMDFGKSNLVKFAFVLDSHSDKDIYEYLHDVHRDNKTIRVQIIGELK